MKNNTRLQQAVDADTLLEALRVRVLADDGPIVGYADAGRLIGRRRDEGVHVGQVCSRIDLACFNAGLPMLTLNWVRKPSGTTNPASLKGWEAYKDDLLRVSRDHCWTAADFDQVAGCLSALPNSSALILWKKIAKLGDQYARRQLHCNV